MNDEELATQFRRSSLLAALAFGIPLLATLLYLLFYLPEPSLFQRQIARVIAAFASAFLAYFFVGRIAIAGIVWGLRISATAGFALFLIIMFFANPFPALQIPKGSLMFTGDTLGGLTAMVDSAYANQETTERIILESDPADRLRNFALQNRDWAGRTWVQVAQRICSIHRCLKCEVASDSKSVTIKVAGEFERHCQDSGCARPTYSCKH